LVYAPYLQNAACAESPHYALDQDPSLASILGARAQNADDESLMIMNVTVDACAAICKAVAPSNEVTIQGTAAAPVYFGYGVNGSDGTNCCTCSGRQCTPIPNVRNSVVFMVLAEPATDPATTAPTPVRACACLIPSEAGTLIHSHASFPNAGTGTVEPGALGSANHGHSYAAADRGK